MTAWVARSAAQVAVLATATLAPWFFGAVQASVQVWLFAALGVATACWLLQQWADRKAIALPWALAPLIAAAVLGASQLIPWDADVLGRLSPRAAELRGALMSEDNPSDAALVEKLGLPALGQRQPLSIYPASTRADLALLTLVISGFVLGAVLFAGRRSSRWLCTVVAINGGALALFGLVQQLTFNGKLYWRVPLTQGGAPFGPFVNRNNASGFLLVCLACALGTVVWAFRRSGFVSPASREPAEHAPRSAWWARLFGACRDFMAHLDAWTLVALTLAGALVAGVCCSLSRGGMVAMAGAGLATGLVALAARSRHARLGWLALVAIAGVGLVGWVGMSQSVQARLATLLDYATAARGRVDHWRDSVRAIPDFWQTGSGLGTYRFIYQPYQEELATAWYYHAENQYLEALVEGGVPGLALMLIMIALVAVAAWRLMRQRADQDTLALGLVGCFALSSQVIQAMFDFGLHILANAVLFGVLCGCVTGRAATAQDNRRARRGSPLPPKTLAGRLLPVWVGVGMMAALIWGVVETSGVAAVETAAKAADRLGPEARRSATTLQEAIGTVEQAIRRRPDDAQGLCYLASLQIQAYRVEAFAQYCRSARPGTDRDELWKATRPPLVHARVQQLARAGLVGTVEALRNEPVVAHHLLPALDALIRARRACPMVPQVHLAIAHLSVLASPPAENQVHLDRAERTAPSQPELAFQCGLLAFQAGRMDRALASWRRSLGSSRAYLEPILERVNEEPDLLGNLEKLLPDSPALLIHLAQKQYRASHHAGVRSWLLGRAAESIERSSHSEAEKHYYRAMVSSLRGDYGGAIDGYARALRLDSRNTRWRYELALLLQQAGRLEEAHQEAKFCVHSEPANRDYRKLLEEINYARAMTATRRP